MADQWGRKIWEAVIGATETPDQNTSDLKEAAYDRRDEDGIEVPGIPGETPPPETSFHQKTHDNILNIKSSTDLYAPGAYASIGHVAGVTPRTINSINQLITSATDPEDLWTGGGLYTGQPDPFTATTITMVSDSLADVGPTGIGAHDIQVVGLDENGDEQIEIFQMQGITPVVSTSLWYRLTYASVVTGDVNIGLITVWETGTPINIFAAIPINEGVGSIAGFTVPSGKSVIISGYSISSGNNDAVGFNRIKLLARKPDGVYQSLDFIETNVAVGQVPKEVSGVLLSEFVDVLLRIARADADISISGSITYLEIDNSLIDPITANYIL